MSIEAIAEAGFAPVAASIAAGRIPGAVLGVLRADGAMAVRFGGAAQLEPARVAATRATTWDLASLTKPIFTTTAILRLVEQGRIALDDALSRAIPDLRQYDMDAAERRLTFRQCLAHATFLPAVEPLYTLGQDPDTLRAYVLQRAWRHGPSVYSDINFILLGIALERLSGRRLGEHDPGPGLSFRPDPASCAATERCTWRRRVMRGEVHDENAFALGGAAGHAGLFGDIDGVLGFARRLMAGEALGPAMLAEIRAPHSARRTPGWEIRHPDWAGGQACSPSTIGHTGFTGTGLWIDWERGLAWSVLSNRVHPTRHAETGIQPMRRAAGDAIIAAFDATIRTRGSA